MQFKFKNITYECSKEQQHKDFLFLLETKDWVTLSNRITNQLKWGFLLGHVPELKVIK